MRGSAELIVPGLFKLPIHELDTTFLEQEIPSLNYILRYGTRVKNRTFELDTMLSESLGLWGEQFLPLAQAYLEKSSQNAGSYFLCQAIHLKPDMRNAIVLPLDNTKETEIEISIIFNELSELFKVDCNIKSISDKLWLVHVKQCKVPGIYPHYLSVLGKKADQYMEQSKQMLPWHQLINEIQMFMHSHEINQHRFEKGLLAINSLWCWGGGDLPALGDNNIHWITSDELLRHYADKIGILNSEPGALADDENGNHTVCIDLSILETLKSVRDENLKPLLSRMEQQFFKPLVRRVKARQITLKLRAGYEFDFILSAFSCFKYWRKAQNLGHFQAQ